jgi:ATP-dependent DNA helicase RecG
VVGGFDLLLTQLKEDKEVFSNNQRLANLLSFNYAEMDESRRKEWVENVLVELERPTLPVKKTPVVKVKILSSFFNSPITKVNGISSVYAKKFAKLNVQTIRDMLYFFPRYHTDYSKKRTISQLKVGEEQTTVVTVWEAFERKTIRGNGNTEAIVGDETGNVRVIWFNQPYIAKQLPPDTQLILSGEVEVFNGQKVFKMPEYEFVNSKELIHTGRLVPFYSLTSGLPQRVCRRRVKEAIDTYAPAITDFLPDEIRKRLKLLELSQAICQAHYPDNDYLKSQARRRLAFDELFLIQLGVLSRKHNWQEEKTGIPLKSDAELVKNFLKAIPFELTQAQKKALAEILRDIKTTKPMSRLLQGDVGSGKTVVALAAMLVAVANGCQSAFMAPTEILAEQHFGSVCSFLSKMGEQVEEGEFYRSFKLGSSSLTVGLLTGGGGKARQELKQGISEGKVDIAIGTHALIQKDVEFKNLAFVVVDEQHRFGVRQRWALRQKGENPHLLVMSATPIPRSLALTLYGDLDLSIIDELPPGRMEIKTKWLGNGRWKKAYEFVKKEVSSGHQAFILCPLIEESEAIEAKAATTEHGRLSKEVFPDLKLGLLHGRLPSSEKDEVMRRFRDGEFDILVSTSVVEIGIDIPNATVMVVEGADRFGLAQLHQFRGRVGRGKWQSYCLLLTEFLSEDARKRIEVIERTQDGFVLAEEDLRLRGPGEFFGTRQSGLPDLKMAQLSDVKLLELARGEAIKIFKSDPHLEKPDHRLLAAEVKRLWENKLTADFGEFPKVPNDC